MRYFAGTAATLPAYAFATQFEPRQQSLGDAAASRGILFGSATTNFELCEPAFAQALARNTKILVPEYELKRNLVEPSRNRIDFSAADKILQFARARNIQFRGHPLVWHKANPSWLIQALAGPRDDRLLAEYIQKIAGHYRRRMHSWDVVNEAIDPDQPQNLRATPWLSMFGPSYIDAAFHLARQADPEALLVYNDWGCEAGGVKHDRFRAATLEFLAGALKRGAPIQALGLQGHLQAFGPQVDQPKLRDFLRRVESMGLKVLVTELDVDDRGGPTGLALRDRAVADSTRRFLNVVLDCRATIAVLTWGLSDRYVQYPYDPDQRGWDARMLPLDAQLQPKPMWHAIMTSLLAARSR